MVWAAERPLVGESDSVGHFGTFPCLERRTRSPEFFCVSAMWVASSVVRVFVCVKFGCAGQDEDSTGIQVTVQDEGDSPQRAQRSQRGEEGKCSVSVSWMAKTPSLCLSPSGERLEILRRCAPQNDGNSCISHRLWTVTEEGLRQAQAERNPFLIQIGCD